ncbi:unnamed protein product [Enterobius vermicularis]|uniref:Transmembrane protein n=1 Tax=Enterobius vermicularis TaxID=51028 RepID=A0A0N4V7E1_ENTVE|nr:unnamed protein product [Enterobius vermicularis]
MIRWFILSRVRIRSATTRLQPRNVFGIGGSDDTYQVGDYYVNAIETQHVLVTNAYDESDPKVVDTLIRIKIAFTRLPYYYMVSIALPIFCIAAVTYVVATVQVPKLSLIWLLLAALAQILMYWQMVDKLPPDHKRTPKCGNETCN